MANVLSPYPNIIDIDVTVAKLLIIVMIRPNIFRTKYDKYIPILFFKRFF